MRVAAKDWLIGTEESCGVTASVVMAARPAEPVAQGSFELGYVSEDQVEHWAPVGVALTVPLERCAPVRRFTAKKGQRHLSGLWWSATTGGHVGFESWLERDHVMVLDFDPVVVGIASQPFWLSWTDEAGKRVSHAPDFFARHTDGTAVVIDCRPVERRGPRDVIKFDATERACALVGWEYRLVGALDVFLVGNLRWLGGYRHPRHRLPEVEGLLRAVFTTPTPLMAGAGLAGDPIAVLPVLFHLLWRGELCADLSVPLHPGTVVSVLAAT